MEDSTVKVDALIALTEKKLALLKELKQAIEAEKFRYTVKREFTQGKVAHYSLFDREENKCIMIEPLGRIDSWLKLRNIPTSEVYRVVSEGLDPKKEAKGMTPYVEYIEPVTKQDC